MFISSGVPLLIMTALEKINQLLLFRVEKKMLGNTKSPKSILIFSI